MNFSLNRAMALTALASALFAAFRSQAISARPSRPSGHQLIENEDVKVWRSLVLPNSPLTMHRHEHPRVIIPLAGGTMNIVDQSGAKEVHVWEAGKAYWLPANPPNTMHADVNAGDKPIEVVVVELQKEK